MAVQKAKFWRPFSWHDPPAVQKAKSWSSWHDPPAVQKAKFWTRSKHDPVEVQKARLESIVKVKFIIIILIKLWAFKPKIL